MKRAQFVGVAEPIVPRHCADSLAAESKRTLVLEKHGQLFPAIPELARHAPGEVFGGWHRVRHESPIVKPERRQRK